MEEQKKEQESEQEWTEKDIKEIEKRIGMPLQKEKEKETEIKTIRTDKSTWLRLNELRGYNGCKTFQDTINFLLDRYKNGQ